MADALPSPHRNRLATLDGLRGFLALAVVFHHAAIYHRFLLDGRWELPPSRFYTMLGQVGVAMFFMVTGYLFWSRLIEEAGRPAWLRLYVGRIFRIGPLYLAAVGAMLALVAIGTELQPTATVTQLVRQVGPWLTLGFLSGSNVNGYPSTDLLLAGVTWTLHYEWLFYLCLPVAALAARDRRLHLPFTLAGLAACLLWMAVHPGYSKGSALDLACAALFLSGMTCASLHSCGLVMRLSDKVASATVLALLALTFALFPAAYAAGPLILLGSAFYLVTSGCTVFGLLVSKPARRLGDISYGIYLLQGLVLTVVLRPYPLRAVALASPVQHWILVLVCASLLIAVAAAAHAVIEQPGIAYGRKVAARLTGRRVATQKAG